MRSSFVATLPAHSSMAKLSVFTTFVALPTTVTGIVDLQRIVAYCCVLLPCSVCDAESKNVGLRAMHECFCAAAVAAGVSSLIAQADRQQGCNKHCQRDAQEPKRIAVLESYMPLALQTQKVAHTS